MFGIPEITSADLTALRAQGAMRLIDVRSAAEVARGIIPGAEHIPMHLIPLKVGEIGDETPTVFYCHSGNRSGQVTAFLMQHGLRSVMNLQGGILAWVNSGQSLSSPA